MIYRKKYGVTVHLRELSMFIGIKTLTTTVFVYISYSDVVWHCVRSKDAHKQCARTSLNFSTRLKMVSCWQEQNIALVNCYRTCGWIIIRELSLRRCSMLTVAYSVCLGGSTSEVILCHQLVGPITGWAYPYKRGGGGNFCNWYSVVSAFPSKWKVLFLSCFILQTPDLSSGLDEPSLTCVCLVS